MSYLPSAKRLSVSHHEGQKLARGSQGQAAGRAILTTQSGKKQKRKKDIEFARHRRIDLGGGSRFSTALSKRI
uniref:40S ribosomal protein S30 n=1 Tax=Macrostomum lignano TaxID=282301 RepID=A0A1I8F956_9PLAT